VAVIGAGPAGLTAAHYLSIAGYEVSIFEKEYEPGGMLYGAIPGYRLPRDVIRAEIDALLDDRITLRCGMALGRDITIDSLLDDGFGAVFVAIGAHESLRLGLERETLPGVIPSITFLKSFNLTGRSLARGRVGVIGGGNSAVDAARVARRQRGVESVTILYRRTQAEMPAFAEEIEAAQEEGIRIRTLVSPVAILEAGGRLAGVRALKTGWARWTTAADGVPNPSPGPSTISRWTRSSSPSARAPTPTASQSPARTASTSMNARAPCAWTWPRWVRAAAASSPAATWRRARIP
jgi:NADPH-dependent glutamate synthase beta subunit-like oxidoreductase